MKVEIQNKPISQRKFNASGVDFDDFLVTLRDIKVGQSFIVPSINSSHRLMLSAVKILMDRKFATKKEEGKYRIGRVS